MAPLTTQSVARGIPTQSVGTSIGSSAVVFGEESPGFSNFMARYMTKLATSTPNEVVLETLVLCHS